MNKSELFSFVKSDSIKNLLKASEVKTKEDIDRFDKENYLIGFIYDELKEEFPIKFAENLYYNNGFDKTFYYDKEKSIIFPVHLYGEAALKPYNEIADEALERAGKLEEAIERGDYFPSLMVVNDKMRMELLNMLIEQDKLKDAYSLFTGFYQNSDYGCSELSMESIKKLYAMKDDKHKAETAKSLKDFPEKITVYRGEGDKSTNWQNSVSWTTDINVANFFAARMSGREARIHVAEADKNDVIEFFKQESECIILSENIRIKDQIHIYGLEFLEEQLPMVAERYKKYRDVILDELEFNIDDEEHGKLHTMRVLLNAIIIGNLKGLSDEDMDVLCNAAIFHDTRRTHNGDDEEHGRNSADYYREFTETFISVAKYSETADNLIQYHCLPDKDGKASMPKSDWLLYDIFKDADGLDRVRFGIQALDIKQLRTQEAKSMTMAADILRQGIQLPEQELDQGMTMT